MDEEGSHAAATYRSLNESWSDQAHTGFPASRTLRMPARTSSSMA